MPIHQKKWHLKWKINIYEEIGWKNLKLENKFNIKVVTDLKDKIGDNVSGYTIIGDDSDIQKFHSKSNYFIITWGQIGGIDLRKK